MLKHVIDTNKYENILVIDADPDANIGDIIGKEIKFSETIGGKMTKLQERIQKRQKDRNVRENRNAPIWHIDGYTWLDGVWLVLPCISIDHIFNGSDGLFHLTDQISHIY